MDLWSAACDRQRESSFAFFAPTTITGAWTANVPTHEDSATTSACRPEATHRLLQHQLEPPTERLSPRNTIEIKVPSKAGSEEQAAPEQADGNLV